MPVPNFSGVNGVPSVAKGLTVVRNFNIGVDPVFPERNLRITGVTRDSSAAVLGSCKVDLFETPTDIKRDETTSDANGNYIVQIPKGLTQTQTTTWYCVAYKAGSPDVFGTTANTLQGA
jgi:hypothetical protein